MEIRQTRRNILGHQYRKLKFSHRIAALLPVFALILPAQLALNSPWQMAFNVGLLVFILGGLLLPVKVPIQRYDAVQFSILILLLVSACVSAAFNRWPRSLLVYGGIMLGFISATRSIEYVKNPSAYVKYLVLGFCFTSLGIVAASFVVQPPTTMRYSGIFSKPNSMGWFGSSASSLLLGVFVYSRAKWRTRETILMAVVFTLSLLLMFICNARSALAGVCTSLCVFGVVFFHSFVMRSKARRTRLIFGLTFIVVVAAVAYWLGFFDRVIEKFQNTALRGDVSQGRFYVWSVHLENWKWFGNGPKYISRYISHNTYVDHLTKYGLVPLILFVMFLGVLFVSGYYYTIRGTYQSAPILLSVVSCFMAQAMFETGTSTPGLWIAIVFYCSLRFELHCSKSERSPRTASRPAYIRT
ncbi:O-Antigen ligase [Mariniblastus fucicola]|uniref:O-Antigen ligase n=1 Tax=Mariniblastus fucicola TaxID=980251 RepID=A0A5B9P6L2_9BACT|nr:O-Antigen ligase [Mariniblastus fucicola]